MKKTIEVIFTNIRRDPKVTDTRYLFLCNNLEVCIGDLITDYRYFTKLLVINIYDRDDAIQNEHALKIVHTDMIEHQSLNISITLEQAREWYNSDNKSLKEVALQAFSKDELLFSFKDITTFKKACEVLNIHYEVTSIIIKDIAMVSKASAAMFKLNIIRKALNLGQYLHLTKDPENSYIYYPYNPFVTKSSTFYKSEINSGKMKVIGKIKSEGEEYNVLGGYANNGGYAGLGIFYSGGVGDASADVGFLGCASEEIAQHFGRYFGMLITEAKYGDMVDFKIIENKYQ